MSIAEKLTTIAGNEQKVFEAGKQAEKNEFWDVFQRSDNNTYVYMFAGSGWTDDNFFPRKDIIPVGQAYGLFYANAVSNLKERFDLMGIRLDFSNCTQANYIFAYSITEELPELDLRKSTTLTSVFHSATKLVTIDGLALPEVTASMAFNYCAALRNITITDELKTSGLDLHWSKRLTAASYNSIMTALSAESEGKTITLPAYETVKAVYDAEYGEGAWDAIVAEKPGWTIAYN